MRPKTRPHFLPLIAWSACAFTFVATQSAPAATGTWTGGPAATWDTTATNWSGVSDPAWDAANGPSNTAIFSTASTTPAVSGTVSANAITFSDTATVSGGTITLAGTVPTITTNADATISSSLAGSAGLTKAGTAMLVLAADNSFTGGVTLDGGALRYTASQTTSPGRLTFGATNGSTNSSGLDLFTTPCDLTTSGLTVQTNSATANTINIGAAKTLTIPGAVTIGATTGTTHLTLSGATGTFAVNAVGGGATNANFHVGGGGTATGTVDMSGVGTFTANLGTGTLAVGVGSGSNANTSPYTLKLAATNSITAAKLSVGAGTGSNSINASAHTMRLGSGGNTINTNDLFIGAYNNQGRGNVSTALNFNTTTGTLTLRGLTGGSTRANVRIGENIGGTASNTSGGKFDLAGSASTSLSGGNADLLIDTLNISHRSGNGTDTSSMTFKSGTMDVNTLLMGKSAGKATTATLAMNGGTVIFNTAVTVGQSTADTATANFNVAGATVTATPGMVMGNQTLTGTVISNVNVSAGSLTLGGDITKVGTTTSTLTVSGGTLDLGGHNMGDATNPITLTAASGTLKNVGAINGNGGLTKTTTGTLTVAGGNTFTGPVVINQGTVSVAGIGNAGAAGNLGAAPQGTDASAPIQFTTNSSKGLKYTGAGETTDRNFYINQQINAVTTIDASGSGALVLSGSVRAFIGNATLGNSYLILRGTNTGDNTLSGSFADNLNGGGRVTLQKLDTGTWSLVGNRNYSGLTDVENGTLKFDSITNAGTQSALGNATRQTIGTTAVGHWISLGSASTSGTLQFTGSGNSASDRTIGLNGDGTLSTGTAAGTLALSGNISALTAGSKTLFLDGANTGANNVSGVIEDASGTVAVTKSGAGTWTLTGPSTYTGATTVNAGTLALTGSLTTSSVEVKNTASLSGGGNIGGGLTIRSGAHHALAVADLDTNQVPRAITGILTLDSGNMLDLTAAAPPADGIYVLATAAGGISGTPTVINLTGVSGVVSVDTLSSPNRLLLTVTSAAGYASWISGFSVSGQNQPGDDPDHDGMDNLLEFVLNGIPNTSDIGILPDLNVTATAFEFTFQRRDDSLSPETTQTFQYGSNLSGWTDVAIPASGGPVGAATITITDGSPADTVKVSIPKTEASGNKLFGRLKVVK